MDVSNVGRIMRSIYCDALFGGVKVLISPLLDGSCFKMLALDNNLEYEKFFHGLLVGNSKRSCWFSFKGSSFYVPPPLFEFKRTLNIECSNNIFFLYHVVGLAPFFLLVWLLINFILYYERVSVNSNFIHAMWWNALA
jgi:hypothetical protein